MKKEDIQKLKDALAEIREINQKITDKSKALRRKYGNS